MPSEHNHPGDRNGLSELRESPRTLRGVLAAATTVAVALAGLLLLSRLDYVFFHSAVELFATAVAWGLFLLVWSSRGFLGSDALTFLGISYFFVGLLGLVHTLAYKGTGLFPAETAGDVATQLWIAARYLEASSLLLFPWLLDRRARPDVVLAACTAATGLLLASILSWRVFPTCYLEGEGLTPFKIVSEYVICAILGAALLSLLHRHRKLDPSVCQLLSLAIGLAIGAELAFTSYVSVYGKSNFTGHLLKLLSLFLLYLALIRSGLTRPYATLFRELAQSENDLSRERALLDAILAATPDFLVLKDRDSIYRKVNPAFCAFLGQTEQEIIGKTDADLFPSEDAEQYVAEDAEVVRSSVSEVRDRWVMGKAGRRWLQVIKTPVRDPSGGTTGILCSVRDIGDRKRFEDILRTRVHLSEHADSHCLEDLLQRTLDESERLTESQIGFLHFVSPDEETVSLQMWSAGTLRSHCKAQGVEQHYPVGSAGVWVDCIRERRAVIHNDYASLPHRKGLPEGHAPLVRELVVPAFRAGKIVGILGVGNKRVDYTQQDEETVSELLTLAWDIVERKRAELALRESEEKFRIFADSSYNWEYWIGPDGTLRYVSPACRRITGYGEDDFLRDPGLMERITNPVDQPLLCGRLVATREHDPRDTEFRILTRDGEERWIAHSCRPVHGEVGQYLGRRATNRDITYRKHMEDALRQSEEEFRTLVENIPGIVYRCEVKAPWRMHQFSRGSEPITGRPASDFTNGGIAYADIILDEDCAHVVREVDRGVASREHFELVYRIRHADGGLRWVHEKGRAFYDEEGRPCFLDGVILDITARKRAEDEAAEKRTQLQALVDSSPSAIIVLSTEGRVVLWNPSAERVFGWTSEEVIEGFLPIIPEEEQAGFNELLEDALVEPRFLSDTSWRRKDGSLVDVSVALSLLRDEQGRPCGVVGILTDITERKLAAERVQQAYERLNYLVGESPSVVFTHELGPEPTLTFISPNIKGILGWEPDRFIGDFAFWKECVHPEDLPRIWESLAEIEKEGKIALEYRFRDSGGAYRWIHDEQRIVERGTGRGEVVGAWWDVTERKTMEAELHQTDKLLQGLMQHSPIFISIFDRHGRYLLADRAVASLFGIDERDLPGMSIHDVLPPDVAGHLLDRIEHVFELGLLLNFEDRFALKGRERVYRTCLFPLLDRNGSIEASVAISQDMTREVQLEEQYHQAQKMEAVGRLAGGIAHDLNNVLSPIIGYSEMLQEDLAPDDARREFVEQVLLAGGRARDLVRQLLAFSRKQSLEVKALDVNHVLRNFEKLLRRTIREDVSIDIIETSDLPAILADMGQIEQVIMNLAVNAQDAMPNGGRITIETALADLDEDFVTRHGGEKPGPYVMLGLSDIGEGMDAGTLDRIFEPFFTTKEKGKGTGLGLSTVYGIVRQHRGMTSVSSERGKGTTFRLYFPAVEEAAGSVKTPREDGPKPAAAAFGTVLVAEDDRTMRDMVVRILEQSGYRVLSGSNGEECLSLLAEHGDRVDLLLTDVIMTDMNGKDLYLRALSLVPKLKVLYMSGYTDDVIAHHGVLKPGIDFIQKPFSLRALAAKLQEVLAG